MELIEMIFESKSLQLSLVMLVTAIVMSFVL